MFERYTERARRSIYYARELVSEYGSITIETEHLLLGILREDPNIIRRFLPSKTIGALTVVWQLGRQHKSSLALQREVAFGHFRTNFVITMSPTRVKNCPSSATAFA